ncbi:MAG: DISARM system phospholipase D-like protein DrmC [Microthrixaceae bacterium]
MSDLADAIAATVRALASAHVRALADAYRDCGPYSTKLAAKARDAIPAPHHGEVDRLNTVWAAHPELPGAALALALDSVQAAQRSADVPTVEVVVTGPASLAAPVRLTSEVVRQLIDQATKRVTLVSYAAYAMASVITALDAAVARGVSVNLILESAENLNGGGGAHAYAKYRTYQWPIDRREPPDAKLHAKAVIIDSCDVLLTSANMTNAAYDKNIELGVLCRGGGVARQVQAHFDGLIKQGVLALVGATSPLTGQ